MVLESHERSWPKQCASPSSGIAYSPDTAADLCVGTVYRFLETPRLLNVKGEARMIGGQKLGATSETVAWVRAEMQNWLSAVVAGLEAEFPFWETAQNFQIFNLSKSFLKEVKWPKLTSCIRRLCKRFQVNEESALHEFRITHPLAYRRACAVGSNEAAWRAAIQGMENRRKLGSSAGGELPSLRKLFALWQALLFSSCGTEHLFSQSERLFPSRRSKLAVSKRRDELVLIFGETPLAELAPVAADAWSRIYKDARQRILVRCDKGLKRGPRKSHVSYKSLERRRVQAVRRAVKKLKSQKVKFTPTCENSKAEVRLQEARLAKATLKASKEGLLLPEDYKDGVVRCALKRARAPLNAKKKLSNAAPKTKPLADPPRPEAASLARGILTGAAKARAQSKKVETVFVDGLTSGVCVDAIRKSFPGCRQVESVLDADLVVTSTGSVRSTHAQMATWLTGSTLMDESAFKQPAGKAKPMQVKFACALGIRRIYVHFRAELQDCPLVRLIKEASRRPFSKWTVVSDRSMYLRWLKAKPAQCFEVLSSRRFASAVAEHGQAELKRRHVLSWPVFLGSLQRQIRASDGMTIH